MIQEIYMVGHFQDVHAITAVQSFPIFVKCSACNTLHDKYIYITADVKVSDDKSVYNYVIECKKCHEKMKMLILPLPLEVVECIDAESKEKVTCDINLSSKHPEGFLVSRMENFNCEVVEIPKMDFDLYGGNGYLFRDVPIEECGWVGTYNEQDSVVIDCWEIKIVNKQA